MHAFRSSLRDAAQLSHSFPAPDGLQQNLSNGRVLTSGAKARTFATLVARLEAAPFQIRPEFQVFRRGVKRWTTLARTSGALVTLLRRRFVRFLVALRAFAAGARLEDWTQAQFFPQPYLALVSILLLGAIATGTPAFAQNTGTTIRHHKVAETDSSTTLAQAEAAIEKRDYAAAEPLLQKVVASEPGNYAAWFDLGFLYNALGQTDQSIDAYRKSVAAKADVFESNLNLGLMLAKAGNPDAERYLRAATTLKPTASPDEGLERAWVSLGHVIEAQKPDEAVEAYQKASTLQPHDTEPYLSAAPLMERQNHFSDAIEQYKKVLEIDPSSTDALTGLANIYMRGRQFTLAEEVLKKLVALRPDDPGAHMQLGRMLAAAGENDAAIAELQAALKLAPNDADLQRDLADVYAASGKQELAANTYRALLNTHPNDAELHARLGKALLMQQKFPEAQEELLKAVTLKQDLGAAYGDLAVAANGTKNYPLVLKALEYRSKFLPEIPVGYFLRATAYDHLRQYKLAAENYHRFLEVANNRYPDQEWQARHRLITIEPKK
jgi:tetratricopeptide (TPR) repeat protein